MENGKTRNEVEELTEKLNRLSNDLSIAVCDKKLLFEVLRASVPDHSAKCPCNPCDAIKRVNRGLDGQTAEEEHF